MVLRNKGIRSLQLVSQYGGAEFRTSFYTNNNRQVLNMSSSTRYVTQIGPQASCMTMDVTNDTRVHSSTTSAYLYAEINAYPMLISACTHEPHVQGKAAAAVRHSDNHPMWTWNAHHVADTRHRHSLHH